MNENDEILEQVFDRWYGLYFDRVLLSVVFVVGLVLAPVEVGRQFFTPLIPLFWIMGVPIWAL